MNNRLANYLKNHWVGLVLPLALATPALAQKAITPDRALDVEVKTVAPMAHNGGEANFARHGRRDDIREARGHYETITERVWVEGVTRRVWVPEVYRTEYDWCGRARRILIAEGYYRTVCEPGHFETRTRMVWVPERRGITPGRGDDHGRGRFDDRRNDRGRGHRRG